MSANPFKQLRIAIIILLALLAIQFEFGMAVNLSALPSISAFGFSFFGVWSALAQAGVVASIHAALGTVLTVLALVGLVMALASRIRSVQIFAGLGLLSMVLAEACGLLFVLSGFQNDNLSHGMATNFLLAFVFYFVELYFLKPAITSKGS